MSSPYFISLPVSLHMTASAVANMAEGKRQLASRLGLAYAASNSAAAVKAALGGVGPVLERVRVSTAACCERVLLATGCEAVGGGGGTVAAGACCERVLPATGCAAGGGGGGVVAG